MARESKKIQGWDWRGRIEIRPYIGEGQNKRAGSIPPLHRIDYGRSPATALSPLMPEKIDAAETAKFMKGWGHMPRMSVPARPT